MKENLKETLPSHNQVYALKSIPKKKKLYLKGQRQPSWPSTLIYHDVILKFTEAIWDLKIPFVALWDDSLP